MGLLSKHKNKEGIVCVKSSTSSFTSAMLCFLNGFNDTNEKDPVKEQKPFRFKLLRKSRSAINFCTNSRSNMVVPKKSHCRTQSAVLPSNLEVSGVSRPDKSLSGSASAVSLLPTVNRSSNSSPSCSGMFTKVDKASLKLLSTSSPAMSPQSQPNITNSPKPTKEEKVHITSKSRQKKFNRHFPTVENEEKVLNYYSCALISDILLQGHLYITKNYFAFYSNVFGYVTKLLIPMLTVEKITKEKTARIIPNAVGISTAGEKHVFGSLMSRDNTYKYMTKIWEISQKAIEEMEPEILVEPEIVENAASESDSSECKEPEVECEKESTATSQITSISNLETQHKSLEDKTKGYHLSLHSKFLQGYKYLLNMPTQTLILFAAIFILILLFLSSIILLNRINEIHDRYSSFLKDHDFSSSSTEDIYSNLIKFTINLHSKSEKSMHNFVDSNLQQIVKIREDLERLSSILMMKDSSNDAKDNPYQHFNMINNY